MIKYNKIVRDKIPEIILANGGICTIKIVSQKEGTELLFEKFHEEINELHEAIHSGNQQHIKDEFIDIFEVFSELRERFKDTADIFWNVNSGTCLPYKTFVQEKAELKGGFKKNIVLIEASELDKDKANGENT